MSQKLQVKFIRYLLLGFMAWVLAIAPMGSITVAQAQKPEPLVTVRKI